MVRRALVTLVLSAFLAAMTPARASAEGLYYVSATQGSLEATSGRVYGVSADSWVLFDPHEVYSLHLSSVYMWLDDGSYVEAGWAWYAGDGPQAYVAYERKGHTTDQQRIWLGRVQPGSWVPLEITSESRGTSGPVRWDCRIGDNTAAVYQDFGVATARASSERQTYRDSDYALFTHLRWLDGAGTWQPWTDMHVQNGDMDYDGYRLRGAGFEVR